MRTLLTIFLLVVSSSFGTSQSQKLHTGEMNARHYQPRTRKVRDSQFQIQGVEVVDRFPMEDEQFSPYVGNLAKRHVVYSGAVPFYFDRAPRLLMNFSHDEPMNRGIPRQATPVAVTEAGGFMRQMPVPSEAGPAAGEVLRGYGPARYYYPPRQPLPLRKCFYNPTGYICCNEILNDLMVHVFAEWEAHPRYHSCNIQAVANMLQVRSEQKFNTTFETIVAYADFAEKVHFSNDLICKIELGGRYALAYGTARNVQEYRLPPINNRPQYGPMTDVAHALLRPRTIRI